MQTPPSGDDLDKPLGVDKAPYGTAPHSRGERGDIPYGRLALLGVAALAVSLGAFVYVTGDPDGGQPFAVASIGAGQPAPAPVRPPPVKTAEAPSAPAADASDPTTGSVRKFTNAGREIEDRFGVKVMRSPGPGGSGALIIEVPESLAVRLAPAPDMRVSQKSEHGILPKIGADGSRPADVYGRRLVLPKGLPAGAPRVAVMVGGLGRDRNATARAIDRLPQEVTLAFTPFGTDLGPQAAKARDEGHEIMLQVPMEPADGAATDAGRRMLIAAAAPSQNIDRLHWIMSRFAGYVGVVGDLGGKFTADAAAMRPVLRDIGDRGLVYADDGTSAGSLAKSLAAETKVQFVATDVLLDATQRGEDIDAALTRLEAIARTRGFAVGGAAGQPATIDRIESWARGLEARGVVLVPMSAVAARTTAVSNLPSPER